MIRFAENLNKMIVAGLGGAMEAPSTEVAVGHRVVYTEVSGAVVNFETNAIAPVKNLRVTMEPIQAGSGDPSPENIRSISGRDSVTVWREASYDPSADPALTIPLGQTVYGGTVDVTGGESKDWWNYVTFDGTERCTAYDDVIVVNKGFPVGASNEYIKCNYTSGVVFANLSNRTFQFSKSVFGVDTADEFKALLTSYYASGNPLAVCYKLATPTEIETTPVPMTTLRGMNNVWSNSGDVTLDYPYYEETEGY